MGNKNEPVIVFGGSKSNDHYHKHNITITEQRAPTDESIKLLDEVYEKTIKRIISHIKVKNTFVEFDAIFMNSPVNEDVQIHVKFMLNGQEQILKFEIPSREYHEYSKKLGWC